VRENALGKTGGKVYRSRQGVDGVEVRGEVSINPNRKSRTIYRRSPKRERKEKTTGGGSEKAVEKKK